MLSVYAGQRCLGHIIAFGKPGFEAFDVDNKSLGIFPSEHDAANAVSKAAGAA
jgi:hypothetical protein